MRRYCAAFLIFACLGLPQAAMAASEPTPLPEPLTLQFALSLAEAAHPQLLQAQADKALAQAEEQAQHAANRLRLSLDSRLRWVVPTGGGGYQDDHALVLRARKPLYDFGVSGALMTAAKAHRRSQEWQYQATLQDRQLTILGHYFDVLLADLRFVRDNEAMAVAFVQADRFRQRVALGQRSEVVLWEAEHRYQALRLQRARSESEQRLSRARLAASLGRPQQLSASLETPALPTSPTIPELETLQTQVRAKNPALLALRQEVQAAIAREQAARHALGPVLLGEIEVGVFARSTSNRDQWRAGVQMEVPLYTGGEAKALLATSQAKRQRLQAELSQQEIVISQKVLEHWLALGRVRLEKEALAALEEFRDLDMERSRTLYELEAEADLGDAMTRMSALHLQQAEAGYQHALIWARLHALQGRATVWP